jgi:general secretion pathway protein D
MRSRRILVLCAFSGLLAAGCPKGHDHYEAARKAEDLQDYDTALQYYQKALATDPQNADYRIKYNQMRFEAGAYHIKKGQQLREKGDLQGAAGEFQHAATIDPGSAVAVQEFRNTVDQINDLARKQDEAAAGPNNTVESDLAAGPPELKPLSEAPVSLKMVNDVKVIFDTIAKQAGINVIYDPDFPARRVSVELNNVTLQQALDIVSMQSKTFWKPVTENIIFVAQDTTQKHKDYDEQMVETFYLSNTVQSQDLTEIANGLRQVLNLTKVQQLNSQNAIIVRDTPDKLAIARRLLKDIDKAKPEVVIQVEVLSASMDRLRDLGVLPGQTASIAFTPPGTTTSSGSSGSSTGSNTTTGAPLKGFSFSSGDFTITLPGATASFVLTDTTSKIIQNPEIRSIDGQPAKLNIGSRVPIATGSFQAGVGVGTTSVNPLVNTQFTYIDVGVNVNITPRIHPNHEVSLKVALEVSQVTSFQTIGGIQQPVIGQNKIEHDIRLREGEASILGGLFAKTDSKTVNGWPGLAQIPLMKYLFSENKTDRQENDILIVLIPRIVRLPDWSRADLRPISSGVEQNITVRRQSEIRTPGTQAPAQPAPAQPQPAPAQPPAAAQPQAANPQAAASAQSARLRFDPPALTLAPGQTATLGVAVDNVNDLYSIPMMLQYDPAVISVEDIQHGTFLSSGNQEIAIVQGGDKSKGQIMIAATRQPNTPGVSGSGTLLGIVVRAVGAGASNVSIVQVNAKDSQQRPLPLVTTEASIQVKPQ